MFTSIPVPLAIPSSNIPAAVPSISISSAVPVLSIVVVPVVPRPPVRVSSVVVSGGSFVRRKRPISMGRVVRLLASFGGGVRRWIRRSRARHPEREKRRGRRNGGVEGRDAVEVHLSSRARKLENVELVSPSPWPSNADSADHLGIPFSPTREMRCLLSISQPLHLPRIARSLTSTPPKPH